MKIIQSPSPNFSKSNFTKIGVQIHKTLGLMPSTLGWLRNPRSWSSCHYLIAKNGDVHQLVDIKKRAWSAGRIKSPSVRAKKIMINNLLGYVKPGHYLIQIEYECLINETLTSKQYESSAWLFEQFDFDVTEDNFLEHQDTAIYKPDMEKERAEIFKRLYKPSECDSKRLVLDNWGQFGIKFEGSKIIIFKKQ